MIDIEEIRKALNEVIIEFGSFDHETGELLPSQSEAVCLAMRAEEKLPLSPETTPSTWNGEGSAKVGQMVNYKKGQGLVPSLVIGRHQLWLWLDVPGVGLVTAQDLPGMVTPIKTPEQIQRDDLRALIEDAYMSKPRGHDGGLDAVAEAVLGKYTLEPKA